MEVLIQTACVWQAYTLGANIPEKCALKAEGQSLTSVYLAKEVIGTAPNETALERIYQVTENTSGVGFIPVPPQSRINARVGNDADPDSLRTSILVCNMKQAFPRWYKFPPKFGTAACVSVFQQGDEKLYVGRGKLINGDTTKTFSVGAFAPSVGLLPLAGVNSSGQVLQITDDFDILCVPIQRSSQRGVIRGP